MAVATGRETVRAGQQPVAGPGPRLRVRPDRSGPAPLDGSWWPGSADPAAELPGLVLALDQWHGRVTRVLLGAAGWNADRPRRMTVTGPAGTRIIRLGWFATMPAGLVTAIFADGQRADLVTIPPGTGGREAGVAGDLVVRSGNREHAPAILAGITAAAGTAATN